MTKVMKITYNIELDAFELWADAGTGWEMIFGAHCVNCKGDRLKEPMFISIEMVETLRAYAAAGYRLMPECFE